ncbi:MAG: heat-inducible transcriptional repressor HrcA [Candidatus Omnitrophica bacterium]|nr:heat-inducible transcriptional repressor HrcA [Candidatus Omnitrophota bacterium]
MEELTPRKERILSFIISSYVDSALPVGSRTIARRFGLGLSPATIRNEMSDLEEMGFISQPHTSAGRIPSDKGYRYYVNQLASRGSAPTEAIKKIGEEFRDKIRSLDELIERTSRILSSVTSEIGVVFYPHFGDLAFQHVELVSLGAGRLLSIWQTPSGIAENFIVDMGEPLGREDLGRITNFLNKELAGIPFSEMGALLERKRKEASDSLVRFYELALRLVRESVERTTSERFCFDGSSLLLEKPEFRDIEKTRHLFQALDDRKQFASVFRASSGGAGVRVFIGHETNCGELWDCSLIASRYFLKEVPAGSLGIIGPRRMPYDRLIPIVDCVSRHFADALERIL